MSHLAHFIEGFEGTPKLQPGDRVIDDRPTARKRGRRGTVSSWSYPGYGDLSWRYVNVKWDGRKTVSPGLPITALRRIFRVPAWRRPNEDGFHARRAP